MVRICRDQVLYVSRRPTEQTAWGYEQFPKLSRAQDGTIEAVEYKNHIVGVQFHPEVDGELGALFRFLSGKPTASL